MVFSEVIYNEQNSYDTKTGKFTCVQPGVYDLQFHCAIEEENACVDLMRNGKRVLHSFITRQKGFTVASGDIYVKLKKGDKVWLVANRGAKSVTRESYFFGHLLFNG